jgi:hypothetical protein
MHDLRVARTKLQSADEPLAIDRQRDDEDAKDVGAIGLQRKRLRQGNDHVGRAELPSVRPAPRRRLRPRMALDSPFVDPLLNRRDFSVGQRMLSDERAVVRVRLPRRHEAFPGHLANLRRVALHLVVGEQRERSRAVRVMTHRTAVVHQRGDVAGIGDR